MRLSQPYKRQKVEGDRFLEQAKSGARIFLIEAIQSQLAARSRELVTDHGEEGAIDGVELLGFPFAGERQANGEIIDRAEVATLGRSAKEGVEEFPSLGVSKLLLEGIHIYGHGRIGMAQ